MSLGLIIYSVLLLLVLGTIPVWRYSRRWGYWPSGGLSLLVVILMVLLLTGRL